MKYNRYEAEDFLVDEDFISWVKQKSGDQAFFFQKWLDSDPPNKDKALFAREVLLCIQTEGLEANNVDYEEVLSNLMRSNQKRTKTLIRFFPQNIWLRYAAILVVVFILSLVIREFSQFNAGSPGEAVSAISQENLPGQRSQIRLPDGSQVFLNASSRIEYSENFGEQSREIELTGEAFFDIKENRNSPFIVKTGDAYTKALGTSFNVKAFNSSEEVLISLVSGKVEIVRERLIWKSGELSKRTARWLSHISTNKISILYIVTAASLPAIGI